MSQNQQRLMWAVNALLLLLRAAALGIVASSSSVLGVLVAVRYIENFNQFGFLLWLIATIVLVVLVVWLSVRLAARESFHVVFSVAPTVLTMIVCFLLFGNHVLFSQDSLSAKLGFYLLTMLVSAVVAVCCSLALSSDDADPK